LSKTFKKMHFDRLNVTIDLILAIKNNYTQRVNLIKIATDSQI
jgi:hypothetical protein